MTTLEDRADNEPDNWRLAAESSGVYRLKTDELTDAEDIGDEWPEYGQFLEATTMNGGTDGEWREGEDVYVECPAGLAQELLDNDVTPGDLFAIGKPSKGQGGRWTFVVSKPETVDDLL